MDTTLFMLGLICILWIPSAEPDEIACPRQVTGMVYGEVTIKCYYSTIPEANKYSRKFCCLQDSRGRCKYTVVSDSGYKANQFLERIDLDDHREKGYFTVTIVGLAKEDEGVYMCGIGVEGNGIKGTLSLSVVEDSVITRDAELIYTQQRGTVIFMCSYEEQDSTQRKHLCMVTRNGCINIIDSTGKTNPSYEGRVTADRQTLGMFTVKLAQVQVKDAGYYICGSDDPEEARNSPTYDVRINRETDIAQGSRLLTPRLGGSLSAQCNYNPKKTYTEKFWCRVQDGVCNPIINTDGSVMPTYEGRVRIHDNSTSGLMQVLMNNISTKDEGWYWCVQAGETYDQTTALQVRISEENLPGLSGNKFMKVAAGDPVKITCSYPCRFRNHERYWCKWTNHECKTLSNVDDTQDRQLISCQTEELVLNIRSASQKDTGFYWCGVRDGLRYGESIYMRLIVEEPSGDVSNTNVRGNFAGDSRNVQVIVPTPSTYNNKSGTVTAIAVSVCVAVFLVCAVFLVLRLRKRKNSDLVSIGSYRTNISLSELDHNVGKENTAVTDLEETDISRSEDSPKIKKKGSREDLDYSCFLINHVGTPSEQVVG